ncbi:MULTISPECIES: 5-dehydro-4-deoxy-D-glucuronate isomerase [Bacteroidota]|uniref:5-dehydro-4-deoxy-D-glucuronate isomerase n=1 Tax=Polaribacter sp. TaxID=1920175 RepID=UPI0040472680
MENNKPYLSISPTEAKTFQTKALTENFLLKTIFMPNQITTFYTTYDRFLVGGAAPVNESLVLKPIDELRADFFLERRELGIINVGDLGVVTVDGVAYELEHEEALYVGRGPKEVVFSNKNGSTPLFYFNSTPAHAAYPTEKISSERAQYVELGDDKNANKRRIKKLIVQEIIPTCQLQMGLTMLYEGNVWNTMPAHTHLRRMEVYFYYNLQGDNAVSHFMGEPQETRHIWMHNHQAVISPPWSIHSGCGTSNYTFIWGMAGENLDYGDMDGVKVKELM